MVSWFTQLHASGELAKIGGAGAKMIGGVLISGGSYACYPDNATVGHGICKACNSSEHCLGAGFNRQAGCSTCTKNCGLSEKYAKLAQKLGQLQPFIAAIPQECMGQPNTFLALVNRTGPPCCDKCCPTGFTEQVRKTPSWPISWANLNLFQLYSHRNAWANLHRPNTFLLQWYDDHPADWPGHPPAFLAQGTTSPGCQRHSDAASYISSAILRTKYTKRSLNDFNFYA
jgi:hypothetical protein